MVKFINIINHEKAEYLKSLGYKYREELIDDKIVYVFLENKELSKIIDNKNNFSNKDFFRSNLMRF